jgi:hypothetical protein
MLELQLDSALGQSIVNFALLEIDLVSQYSNAST